jgi:hypothetical protein
MFQESGCYKERGQFGKLVFEAWFELLKLGNSASYDLRVRRKAIKRPSQCGDVED